MAHTFDSALDYESITVLYRDDSKGLFVIRLGNLSPEVEIRLGRQMDNDTTLFWISHAIKTPLQATPYRTSRPWGDYPAYALHQAVSGLTMYFDEAVRKGHNPDDSWLVEY